METYFLNIQEITENDIKLIQHFFPLRYRLAVNLSEKKDFLHCIGAYLLLYKYLNINDESLIKIGRCGKPYFEKGPYFNYSHSGDLVVLVINDSEVGVDIELIDEKNLKYKDKIFTSREEQEYINRNPLENFHLLWTRLEATKKCLGNISLTKKINVPLGANVAEIEQKHIELKSEIRGQYAFSIAKII